MQGVHLSEEQFPTHKKVWHQWLKGNQAYRRLLLLISFLAVLTYFLHFREVRLEVLETGTSAPRYVISQADFDFLDEEASQLLKQEAIRDIGAIFKIEESQLQAYRSDLETALIRSQTWRQELPLTTFEELYNLLDLIEEDLGTLRFTNERTLYYMKRVQLPTSEVFPLDPPSTASQIVEIPTSFWEFLYRQLERQRGGQKEAIRLVIDAFSKDQWDLQQDFSLERTLRQRVQEQVSGRYTHIEAGAQIIKKGEKVTPRHIAMVLAMKKALSRIHHSWSPLTLLGSGMISICVVFVSLLYLYTFHRDLTKSLQKMTLLVTVITIGLVLAKGAESLLLYEGKNLSEVARFPLLLPFISFMTCVLIGSEISLIISLFFLILTSITLAIDPVPFLLLNFFSAIATILFAKKVHRRKEVFSVMGKVWISAIPLLIAFNLLDNRLWHMNLVTDLMTTLVFLVASSLIIIGLLPILEGLFHVMTDMTLMEYMDPDHELLRRLSLEAPGTYQHCLVVGNLAEAGARAIGANGLFCRVSTLYHDIGKLFNPHYFTENQLGGFNIHQLLTPLESTQVITAHVAEGEALARKYRLPQSFIEIIREHHGTTMVYYFYCKQIEQMGGDVAKVQEKMFRYPGPKPRSKESAIIMIADTVEAASRSMDEVGEEAVTETVNKLVAEKAEDGQFDDCRLTFEELGRVKQAIVKALMVTRHLRVKYPDRLSRF